MEKARMVWGSGRREKERKREQQERKREGETGEEVATYSPSPSARWVGGSSHPGRWWVAASGGRWVGKGIKARGPCRPGLSVKSAQSVRSQRSHTPAPHSAPIAALPGPRWTSGMAISSSRPLWTLGPSRLWPSCLSSGRGELVGAGLGYTVWVGGNCLKRGGWGGGGPALTGTLLPLLRALLRHP